MTPEDGESKPLELFATPGFSADSSAVSPVEEPCSGEAEPEETILLSEESSDVDQLSLIDADEEWKREWQGMPEFIQKDLEPYKTVYVHFESRADMDAFAKLVAQRITFNTKSIWYPQAEIGRFANKRYIDES